MSNRQNYQEGSAEKTQKQSVFPRLISIRKLKNKCSIDRIIWTLRDGLEQTSQDQVFLPGKVEPETEKINVQETKSSGL